jgi:hypothetical protein
VDGHAPINMTRAPLIPPWPSAVRTAAPPARGSNRRSLRSRDVVAKRVPEGENARDWIASACPVSVSRGASGAARSQSCVSCEHAEAVR